MITRGENFKTIPLNIVGSSTFGRYFKISHEITRNMFISDKWLVDYAGYQKVVFTEDLGSVGRGIFTSTKLNRLIAVVDANVWLLNIFYDQNSQTTITSPPILIGTLQTATGVVYITENNKPQVVISDSVQIYFYDPALTPTFQIATQDGTTPISFTPGYISFHDTRILAAARNDTGAGPVTLNNTWRLGILDPAGSGKLIFPNSPDNISYIGAIQRKPDNTQAAIPIPSKGNMVLILGNIVGETFFDTGAQKFPYQVFNQNDFDYGTLNPATVAYLDELVVWLAINEKSGPIIVYTNGSDLQKITTDGIDYLFSQLQTPQDSQGFLYRQDGHLIYHINFYSDNLSLFYDFNTKKFFHASDENGNYFIAAQIAFFNNQYYFVTKNNGNIYAFDTIYPTYDGAEIPRERIPGHINAIDQGYNIMNDMGFTIEQGENNPFPNSVNNLLILNGGSGYTTATLMFVGGNGSGATATATITSGVITAITLTNPGVNYTFPPTVIITGDGSGADIVATLAATSARIDLSMSYDGGQTFGNDSQYILNPDGQRMNRLMWWNLGIANDAVPRFRFYALGRFVAYDGEVNLRR
jgi:hypothetical protein